MYNDKDAIIIGCHGILDKLLLVIELNMSNKGDLPTLMKELKKSGQKSIPLIINSGTQSEVEKLINTSIKDIMDVEG